MHGAAPPNENLIGSLSQFNFLDDILTLEACVIFFFSLTIMLAAYRLQRQSSEIYQVVLEVLEAKAERFFDDHGIEKAKKKIGFFQTEFIEQPRLHHLETDKKNSSKAPAGLSGLILIGFVIFGFWATLKVFEMIVNGSFPHPLDTSVETFLKIAVIAFLNDFMIFLSITLLGASLYLSVLTLMRYGAITALYAAFENRTSLQENGVLVGTILSLLSILGSASSIVGLIVFVLE